MAELTQKNRALKIDTPLGEDKLLLQSFTGGEEISRLFRFQLDLISEDANIKPKSIVGKNVTLRVVHADSTTERYFNGYISRFSLLPSPVLARHASYQAEMVPWPWFLTLTADCRIFQHKSVPDIIKDVFGRFGFTDYSFELQGQHHGPRLLRAIPRNRLQLRHAPDGGGRYVLFLQAREDQAHPGGRRSQGRAPALPVSGQNQHGADRGDRLHPRRGYHPTLGAAVRVPHGQMGANRL